MTEKETNARTMLDAGTAIASPTGFENGAPFTVVPDGYRLANMEAFLSHPIRHRGEIEAETPEAFIAYYNRFCDTEASLVFASTEQFRLNGVIDYHKPAAEAGNRDHQVIYRAPRSAEWKTWTEQDGVQMAQQEFATFIEDNVKDIRKPAGADILELARDLEVKKAVRFASSMRLHDGQRTFGYSEDVNGSSRQGQMKIPETFVLGVPVFVDGELYEVTARLRFRIDSGVLRLWYDLLNQEAVERDAFGAIVTEVSEGIETKVLMAVAG